jgi:16S rRNA (guanine966-N2)-methyltransferase
MRIIAGHLKGLTLASVGKGDPAAHLRPTSDRVRESLFSMLFSSNPDLFDGARILDLFAGTGALGLEALSRGGTCATFVDSGAKSQSLLNENIRKARVGDVTKTIKRDVTKPVTNTDAPYDLVFLDPPYGKDLGVRALKAADTGNWISDGATVIWEDNSPQDPPSGYVLEDHRRYGDTHITILTREQTDAS